MSRVSITVDVPEEWVSTADEIADSLGVTRTDVFRDAVSQYMANYQQQVIESEEALQDFLAGRTLSHEEVMQRFAERTRSVQAA